MLILSRKETFESYVHLELCILDRIFEHFVMFAGPQNYDRFSFVTITLLVCVLSLFKLLIKWFQKKKRAQVFGSRLCVQAPAGYIVEFLGHFTRTVHFSPWMFK